MAVKDEVLRRLTDHKGEAVSGESLAQELGVSRTAVWKAIKSLQSAGYPIEAGTNRGYSLPEDTDFMSGEAIKAFLAEDIPVYYYDKVTSTNDKAREIAADHNPARALVAANCQTSGRGRIGRVFASPAGKGLYMSIILRPSFDMSRSVLVTTAASVAVVRALEKLYDIHPKIKWVNDIYLDGKKITGILTEAVTDFESGQIESLIVGIGVNCFESSAAEKEASSYGFIGGSISRNTLAAQIVNEFMPIADNIEDRSFIEDYREHSNGIGRSVLVYKAGSLGDPDARPLRAKATGIAENGGLIIVHEDGPLKGETEILTSGEISIRFSDADII